ncbi:hypothetical protein AB6A40_009127 [Gnathostoma spinigerum]|uniref:Protein XRP2 n=1 Tax=Gnathostoma spinigerum TaxID=75299 RepID=A0ABD6ER43_9BILA
MCREKTHLDPANYKFVRRYGEIVAKLDGHVAGQQFVIDNCKECCILVLDHTKSVTIDDCEKCLIVLGPCKGSVFIRDCVNCSVFTACQQFRSRDCINMDIFLFCATPPIIESSRQMRFRSLALSYEKLDDHMANAGLSPFINNWKNIHDFTPETNANFTICETEYNSIENMDLLNNLEKVKFTRELSYFPVYSLSDVPLEETVILLSKDPSKGKTSELYSTTRNELKEFLARGAQVLSTKDLIIRKGDLNAVCQLKNAADFSGRLVVIELAFSMSEAKDILSSGEHHLELVCDEEKAAYRIDLRKLEQIQMLL